jgi:hypothetical protein
MAKQRTDLIGASHASLLAARVATICNSYHRQQQI